MVNPCDKIKVAFSVDPAVDAGLERYCEETGMKKNAVAERAIRQYIAAVMKKLDREKGRTKA